LGVPLLFVFGAILIGNYGRLGGLSLLAGALLCLVLLLPFIQTVREESERGQAKSDLKSIALALRDEGNDLLAADWDTDPLTRPIDVSRWKASTRSSKTEDAGIAVGMGDGSARIAQLKSSSTWYAANTPNSNDLLPRPPRLRQWFPETV